MKIESLKLVCFSPTGTTNAIVKAVALGINISKGELTDITRPGIRKQQSETFENELLIIGVPVYMGRVPAILSQYLNAIRAHNTPVVCIVVYGNRAYEDALLELRDILIKRGCIPVAFGAYIGEHSFSSSDLPTAESRPDAFDLNHAELFGNRIYQKLQTVSSADQISDIMIPGNYPYGGITKLWDVDFISVSTECTQCGICAECCPAGAIDPGNSKLIDIEKCITCCACIKNCPVSARRMKDGLVRDAAIRLNKLYKKRKEPVFFL